MREWFRCSAQPKATRVDYHMHELDALRWHRPGHHSGVLFCSLDRDIDPSGPCKVKLSTCYHAPLPLRIFGFMM